ncbi:hypothetical protein [Frigoriglobus tundricola]|uniref:Transmembrane protein n=1 Tax=Frigoriglobus tundricola TaxID=2774151 RepID=A0A6M5YSA3_9BACT|nr:hypothetical protein [Frigoriglobus tundricola]QJW96957.1 hypothetical protein FTUN_4517 [Frigoriglobus tundricola]
MRAHNNKADVVAVFENQDDADEAVLQLRLSGFRDRQIGYYGRHLDGTAEDLLEHDRWFGGAVVGGVIGAALGAVAAPALAWLMAAPTGPHDLFGLAITSAVVGALFLSFIGGWMGMSVARRSVALPESGAADGAFVLALMAGAARDRAWGIIRRFGGHEPHAGVTMPRAATI